MENKWNVGNRIAVCKWNDCYLELPWRRLQGYIVHARQLNDERRRKDNFVSFLFIFRIIWRWFCRWEARAPTQPEQTWLTLYQTTPARRDSETDQLQFSFFFLPLFLCLVFFVSFTCLISSQHNNWNLSNKHNHQDSSRATEMSFCKNNRPLRNAFAVDDKGGVFNYFLFLPIDEK